MNLKNKLLLFAGIGFLALPFNKVDAQVASVKAFTNERKIVIGDQVHLFLEVKPASKSDKVQWTAMPDSIHGLEIVEKGKIDSVADGTSYTLKQKLLVTGFDSGRFYIPAFHFQVTTNGQTSQYATDSMPIDVQTVAVDTSKAFKPIKDIVAVKFSLLDYWKEILAGVVLIGFIVFLVWYFVKNKNTKVPEKQTKAPPEKAHEKALRLLSELKAKQYMQQGKGKEYFTEMSDIVRTYLEERFAITAMEQTTDELLSLLKKQTDNKAELRKVRPELKTILRTADLAKFAKANPLPDEYEACYAAAQEVIRRTQFKEEEGAQ
jgi:large-conductance mechanosensitive channel